MPTFHTKAPSRKIPAETINPDVQAIADLAAWAAKAHIPVWDAGLQCRVFSTDYDAVAQTGTIAIEWGTLPTWQAPFVNSASISP